MLYLISSECRKNNVHQSVVFELEGKKSASRTQPVAADGALNYGVVIFFKEKSLVASYSEKAR